LTVELDRSANLRVILGVLRVWHVLVLRRLTERLWRGRIVCWNVLATLCSLLRARVSDC
jgi:hypothetical protein